MLTGSADAQLVDCLGGQRPSQVAELMFGRNIGGRLGVNETEWSRFLDNEILSRFPKGLTVMNAAGEWRDEASNRIVREPSKVVQIVLPGEDGFAVCEQIARDESSRPLVVLTSTRDAASYGERVVHSSARGFIPKTDLTGATLAALIE